MAEQKATPGTAPAAASAQHGAVRRPKRDHRPRRRSAPDGRWRHAGAEFLSLPRLMVRAFSAGIETSAIAFKPET